MNQREERFAFRQLHRRQMRSRDAVRQRVQVADRLHTRYAPGGRRVGLQKPYNESGKHDSRQTAGDTLRDLRHKDTQQQREDTDAECPPVHLKMLGVENPFIDEVRRHVRQTHAEEIIHLCGEYRQRDTGCETHDDGVGNELDHIA